MPRSVCTSINADKITSQDSHDYSAFLMREKLLEPLQGFDWRFLQILGESYYRMGYR